jgi:hypothetical protein
LDPPERDQGDKGRDHTLEDVYPTPAAIPQGIVQLTDTESKEASERAGSEKSAQNSLGHSR